MERQVVPFAVQLQSKKISQVNMFNGVHPRIFFETLSDRLIDLWSFTDLLKSGSFEKEFNSITFPLQDGTYYKLDDIFEGMKIPETKKRNNIHLFLEAVITKF